MTDRSATPRSVSAPARTYQVRTYGCQMNVHDSERISGLLEDAGYVPRRPDGHRRTSSSSTPARSGRTPTTGSTATSATCARSRTATPACRSRSAAAWPRRTGARSSRKAPWVDVVFGTHNIGSLPVLLERARHNAEAAGRDPGVAGGLPVDAADPARVDLRRLGVDLGRLQQHLHLLHRAVACAARRRTAGPATILAEVRGAGRRGRARGDPARARTSTPTASSSATGSPSASCCAPAARSTGWSGCASPARTRRTSPTT